MIHVIVYANRADRGYDFYERSENFPAEYLPSIAQICGDISSVQNHAAAFPAVRYAPLADQYLLSLILRQPGGSREQERSHSISVHFLMEPPDADAFFANDLDTGIQRCAMVMNSILADRQLPGPDELGEMLLAPARSLPSMHFLPRSVLLVGAVYSQEQPPARQLFLACDTSPVQELDQLLTMLPPALRKQLRFHTGIATAGESRGTALNFCTGRTLADLVSSGFPGSQNTDKFWSDFSICGLSDSSDTQLLHQCQTLLDRKEIPMYHKLCLAVEQWDEYWNFLHAALAPAPLEAALAVVPEQPLMGLIQQNIFTREELHRLFGATRSMAVKLAIRLVLHRPEIREKPSEPNPLSRLLSRFRHDPNS